MSKSILVVDKPECCDYCPIGRIFGMAGQVECMASKNIRVNQDGKTIPDWCPLKEVPDKRKAEDYLDDNAEAFVDGYNTCINEILAEKKE